MTVLEEMTALCREAGARARQMQAAIPIEVKGDRTLVTEADRSIERFLRAALAEIDPQAGFIGEEQGASGNRDRVWVIDPIDGTSNYAYGLPIWGVTVARMVDGRVTEGVIEMPALQETYAAQAGMGATLNGATIYARDGDAFSREEPICLAGDCTTADAIDRSPSKVRVVGSAVAKLAWTAAGRFRGAVVIGKLWDLAAGWLICQESGAETRDLQGRLWTPDTLLDGSRVTPAAPLLTAAPRTMRALLQAYGPVYGVTAGR